MNHPQPPTLVIIGNIGSGKSTATGILALALKANRIDADDLFQTSDPFSKRYLENMSRWAFTNELWLTVERVRLIRSALQRRGKKLTIVDSGVLMSWVYTYGHFLNGVITEDEWQLYATLYEELAEGILSEITVVNLNYSLPTLMARIKKRGRDYELAFYTQEYLEQIQSGIEALLRRLQQKKVSVISIEESAITDFEHRKVDQKRLIDLVGEVI